MTFPEDVREDVESWTVGRLLDALRPDSPQWAAVNAAVQEIADQHVEQALDARAAGEI